MLVPLHGGCAKKKTSIKSQDAFPCAAGFESASFWSQAVSFKTE